MACSAVTEKKKKCPLPFPWLWVVAAVVGAVVGFIAWQRTRPVDDPWAEESWEDLDEDLMSNS